MASKFIKTVKNVRRGISFSKKLKHRLFSVVILFIALLLSCAFLVWWQEKNFNGSYFDSLWSVMFTLIGQGEFASSPHTFWGRVIVFLISVFGVALFGVVFAEVIQRIINSKLKEIVGDILGMNSCKFENHVIICGWNGRGIYLIKELTASGRQVSLIASNRPDNLNPDVFFIQGNPSERESLIRAGVQKAKAAIILGDPEFGDDDSHTILTALAIETISHDVYTVMELHNPDNERYAKYAHVDDILYTDSLIADITAMCTHNEGISAFIRDILSTADEGHSFASFEVPEKFAGKKIREMFADYHNAGKLPIAIITPPENNKNASASEWVSEVSPEAEKIIKLPMKIVCIVKDNYAE